MSPFLRGSTEVKGSTIGQAVPKKFKLSAQHQTASNDMIEYRRHSRAGRLGGFMNSRSQQAVIDAITAAAVIVLAAVLVAAGQLLIGEAATGPRGDLARLLGDIGGPHGPTV